jgi:hypothetical protein
MRANLTELLSIALQVIPNGSNADCFAHVSGTALFLLIFFFLVIHVHQQTSPKVCQVASAELQITNELWIALQQPS